jgi:hypothetical protein
MQMRLGRRLKETRFDGPVLAAEIKCLFPLAFRSSLSEVVPLFEKYTGNSS